jgi:hypothetical protein
VTAFELSQKKRSDQESAQHEEDIDAQEARTCVRQAEMEGHHRSDGEQAQSVERVVTRSIGGACRLSHLTACRS